MGSCASAGKDDRSSLRTDARGSFLRPRIVRWTCNPTSPLAAPYRAAQDPHRTISLASPTPMRTGTKTRAEPSEARTRPDNDACGCVLDAHPIRHALDSLNAPLEGKSRENVVEPVPFLLVAPVVLFAPILDPGSRAGILHRVHSGLLFLWAGSGGVTSTRRAIYVTPVFSQITYCLSTNSQ